MTPRPSVAMGSSPHTRGARQTPGSSMRNTGIIPAYAGSTPSGARPRSGSRDHPRIRGEHEPDGVGGGLGVWIIPAYAGSTPSTSGQVGGDADHPRIRGEHAARRSILRMSPGSSPHTRGARRRFHADGRRVGIIPAYAGSTIRTWTPPRDPADHPRIRGEHSSVLPGTAKIWGSSPHTRGALDGPDRFDRDGRIIPAYAGSTKWDEFLLMSRLGSSPHTRGARSVRHGADGGSGIIPAYAGSTCKSPGKSSRWSDHPRIRGEPSPALMPSEGRSGSSPHTRGARPPCTRRPSSCRIIPAYAGSTRRL